MTLENELQMEELEEFDHFLTTFVRYKNKLNAEQQKDLNQKLNATKIQIIYMLSRERLMAVDVAKRLQLSSGATTIVLNQLETDGYVMRERSAQDRRIVWLSLTEEGDSTAETLLANRKRINSELLGLLSQEERRQFLEIVKKIDERMLDVLK
ncbi:winged helix DNA-binding protein [Neobacillus mesonae]|nr:winged helix DNA-binding protein [Neobacillus mesonae]